MIFNIGEKYVGTVVSIESYGAVLQFQDGTTQLLHISHISDQFVQNIGDYINVGDNLEVFVIPGKIKSIELTIRKSEIDRYESTDNYTFDELLDAYPPNERDIRYKDKILTAKPRGNRRHKKK